MSTRIRTGKEMPLTAQNPLTKWTSCAVILPWASLSGAPVVAQSPPPQTPAVMASTAQEPAYSANRGRWNFGAQVGYSMEYGLDWHEVSHIQILLAQPQLGFIVRDFRQSLVRRFEIIDEGILGAAVHPSAAYLAGDTLILRLEGKEHGRWVPFLDAGAGVLRTPLSKHVPEIDGFTQFLPEGGLGLEYFLRPQRALVLEWRTIHMSNANLVPPNMGFNSSMLTVGFRWLRRPTASGDRVIR